MRKCSDILLSNKDRYLVTVLAIFIGKKIKEWQQMAAYLSPAHGTPVGNQCSTAGVSNSE